MSEIAQVNWIAVDWGTTNLRAWAMDGHRSLAEASSDKTALGLETLKSLAAVFEINVNDLREEQSMTPEITLSEIKSNSDESIQQQKAALEKAQSIKSLYLTIFCVIVIFLLFIVPNYNGGENLGAIVVVGISFAAMIGFYAYSIFKPFDEEWEQNKAKEILKKQENNCEDSS